jgi:hypothetical protein
MRLHALLTKALSSFTCDRVRVLGGKESEPRLGGLSCATPARGAKISQPFDGLTVLGVAGIVDFLNFPTIPTIKELEKGKSIHA